MLDKKKKYTYEELKGIIEEAHKQAIEELQKSLDEKRETVGKKNYTASMMFMMQNLLVTRKIEETLFGKDDAK